MYSILWNVCSSLSSLLALFAASENNGHTQMRQSIQRHTITGCQKTTGVNMYSGNQHKEVSKITNFYSITILGMHDNIALLPDPTHKEGKRLWTLKRFPGLAHRHQTACAPIRMYANYHMAPELAESRIGTNVPRIFPHMCSGVWKRDYA